MPIHPIQQKPHFGSLRKAPHWSTKALELYTLFTPAGMLRDLSKNNFSAPITGAAWVAAGLDFDGVNDFASVPADDRLENFSEFTIFSRCFPQGDPGTGFGRLITKRQGTTSDDYALSHIDPGADEFKINFRVNTADGTENIRSDTQLLANTRWYFVVGTWVQATGTMRLYIDGVQEPNISTLATGALDNTNETLDIGGHSGSNIRRFNGLIAETGVYGRALNPSEIMELYLKPYLPIEKYSPYGFVAGAPATNPKGPFTHPLWGPFAGPLVA